MGLSGDNPNALARRRRILVLSHVNPVPRRSGQQQRVYYTLLALRKRFHVTFVTFAESSRHTQIREELLLLCDEVELLPSKYASSAGSKLWHRLAGWFYQQTTGLKFSNYVIGRVELAPSRLEPLLRKTRYDLALFEYFHASASAALFQRHNIPCVLDMHNILWQSFARQLTGRGIVGETARRAVGRYRAAEEHAWTKFDALIAISAGERDYAQRKLQVGQRLFYAPMGLPLGDWPYGWKHRQPSRIAYYGALGSSHNAADARRCYERIMPTIWSRFADAEFWIIGTNPPPELRQLAECDPRVKVTGFVERVQDVLKTISVILCPFTGTYGFRSRVVEVLALGIPVVATPDAVYGMDLKENRGLFLAESDEAMAYAATRLLADVNFARAQSREARTQIEENYSFETSYARLATDLRDFAEQAHGCAHRERLGAVQGSVN